MFSHNVVSIDIGSKNIKIVEGKKEESSIRIKKNIILPTPQNAFEDGNILDIHHLKEAIKDALKEEKIKSKKVIFTVQSTSIITREFILPFAKEKEIENMIYFEIEQFLPISLEDYIIQYKILEEFVEDNVKKSRIFIAAMYKKMAESYLSLSKELNLMPQALDLNSNAIWKLFSLKKEREENKTIAIIDMGYNYLNLNIISKGISQFSRLIPLGGKEVDIGIANRMNLSLEEAEENKIKNTKLDEIGNELKDNELNNIVKYAVDNWIEDIQRIFQYYKSRSTGNTIDYIYIYGGSSNITGLSEYISSTLNIQTYKVDKMTKITLKKKVKDRNIELYLNAVGAILRK